MLATRRNDEADAASNAIDDSLCAILAANASAYKPLALPLPQTPGKDLKIQVACRCRPLLPAEITSVGTTVAGGGITHVPEFPNCYVRDPEVHVHTEKRHIGVPDPNGALETKKFRLHSAFSPECEDESIYSTLVSPLLDGVRSGGRAAIIAYGQTGSGKTYSMGRLMQRAADDIFHDRHHQQVTVSFFELRGELCSDLLSERRELSIRQDSAGAIVIGGLSELAVGSAQELREVIERGSALRRTAATTGNAQSSRSHAFCDIKYNDKGVLRFVDLAGSERRADSIDHDLERIKEMKEINGSLGNLKECIRLVLANSLTKKKQHVPYRRSKLTRLLQAELGGEGGEMNSRTAFLVHVSPMRSEYLHTINTLTYAEAMITATRADKEKSAFKGTDAWSPKKVSAWVAQLDSGRYAGLADSFHLSGKTFGAAWISDIIKRTEAAGGTEADGNAIYDAFHRVRKKLKKTQGRLPAKASEDKNPLTLQDLSLNENKA